MNYISGGARRRVVSALVGLSAVVGLVGMAMPEAAFADTVSVTFAKTSQWDSGFVGEYTIANKGTTTVNGWRLEFDLVSNATLTSFWNGLLTQSGTHYTALNESWNGTLGPGASTDFTFQVATPTPSIVPTGCLLNGGSCSGSTTTTTKASTTTTTTRPSTTTTTQPTTTTTTTQPTTTTTTVPPGPGTGFFAPYADVTLWPPIDLPATATASGVKSFTLAFIVNGSGTCQASWGGVMALADGPSASSVAQLRAQGGDVIVSFGGANGVELAQSCTTATALANQYQSVIDFYGLT
ncbi:MAG: cellulose binding domain-containing protein, partial [Actinobacteria bacterium]|nr:cellulose binding domain-containing protein [Actinomycetota bacterium]